MSSCNPWPAFEKKVHKIQERFGIVSSHGLAWAKWRATNVVSHSKGQSLTVLPFSCFSISPPTSFFICATESWLMPTKATTLRVETSLLICTKTRCFYSWGNRGTRLQTILQIAPHVLWNQGYTMHREISRHSQLHNAHIGVDVGRMVVNQNEYCNPNHFDISYFKNPKSFSLFGFTFMQLTT